MNQQMHRNTKMRTEIMRSDKLTRVMTSALGFQLLKSPISAAHYKDKKTGK
jgi:hypothetical protein